MVWIHGGAFLVGNGYDKPDYLVAKDVIVVSINYRLGALGKILCSQENISLFFVKKIFYLVYLKALKYAVKCIKYTHTHVTYYKV